MKKIVFFNSTMQMGGPARVINLWGNYFVNNGYRVEVVSNIDVPLFYEFDTRIQYSILGIDKFNQSSKIKTLFKIYGFLKNRKNEILVFNKGLYITYLFFLKKLGLIDNSLQLVYFAHGGSSDFKSMYNNFTNFMINHTFDNIIALHNDYDNFSLKSSAFKRKIINTVFLNNWNLISEKISYIPNPVTFRVNGTVSYSHKTIVAVGRLDKIKGFDLLIESWRLINQKYEEWILKIVGSGIEEEALKEQAKNIQNIQFISEQKDIKKEYLSSSIYVMSSREEGMPMVIVEAMESGLPIVAFNNVGAKYLVKENGLLCEVGDVKTLADNLEKLINNKNLREMYGEKSKKMAKNFYIESLITKWDKILKGKDV